MGGVVGSSGAGHLITLSGGTWQPAAESPRPDTTKRYQGRAIIVCQDHSMRIKRGGRATRPCQESAVCRERFWSWCSLSW